MYLLFLGFVFLSTVLRSLRTELPVSFILFDMCNLNAQKLLEIIDGNEKVIRLTSVTVNAAGLV